MVNYSEPENFEGRSTNSDFQIKVKLNYMWHSHNKSSLIAEKDLVRKSTRREKGYSPHSSVKFHAMSKEL